jgi:hypothetical protein
LEDGTRSLLEAAAAAAATAAGEEEGRPLPRPLKDLPLIADDVILDEERGEQLDHGEKVDVLQREGDKRRLANLRADGYGGH